MPAQDVGVGVDRPSETTQVVADADRLLVAMAGAGAQHVGRLAGEHVLRQRGGPLEGLGRGLDLAPDASDGVAVGVDGVGLDPVVVAADRVAEAQPVLLGLDAVDDHLRHGFTCSSRAATWAASPTIRSSSSKSSTESLDRPGDAAAPPGDLLGVLDEAGVRPRRGDHATELVRGVVDVAERGPQVLTGGVEVLPGAAQRPLVDRDRPHAALLPRWTGSKPEVVKNGERRLAWFAQTCPESWASRSSRRPSRSAHALSGMADFRPPPCAHTGSTSMAELGLAGERAQLVELVPEGRPAAGGVVVHGSVHVVGARRRTK